MPTAAPYPAHTADREVHLMPKPLHESATLTEATTSSDTATGLLEVEFITPGWGSSGYYSPAVVEAAAPLFEAGTHMYFDHPTETEHHERPVRSVRDLAAVIVEAGHVDATTGGIRGKVRPLRPYRDLLTDEAFTANVGVSIRASASDITLGEAEGRRGPIIESLVDLASVDFVTRAGRGGSILGVLESARQADVHEATASDRHSQLQRAVRAAYDGPGRWVYVRDHDADQRVVWFDVSSEGPTETWSQTYDVSDSDVDITLTGEPTAVSALTTYVPVARPGSTIPTQESKEDTMPQIEEARLRQLEADAGRVPTLESERDTAVAERDEARNDLAAHRRVDRARAIISARAQEAGIAFTPLETRGLLADLPLKEGALDEDAFTATVDEAAKPPAAGTTTAPSTGVTGFGASATPTAQESAPARPTTNPWGRPLTESKGA